MESVETWCPLRGLDVLYIRSLSMTWLALPFSLGLSQDSKKIYKYIYIYIYHCQVLGFLFSYQVPTFPAEEKYHVLWIQSMRIKLIYFTFEILTYTANFIHMFIYFYSYNMISIYNFFSWWLFLLSCSNTTNFLLE